MLNCSSAIVEVKRLTCGGRDAVICIMHIINFRQDDTQICHRIVIRLASMALLASPEPMMPDAVAHAGIEHVITVDAEGIIAAWRATA